MATWEDVPSSDLRVVESLELLELFGDFRHVLFKVHFFINTLRRRANKKERVDACESAVEIVTPYWASNSAGKLRAIVNTQHLQQAIHQEVCQSTQTKKCASDCTCEQKYKWHRLLAYDPDDDCKGIFMDWFLFPSCCICRCAPPLKSN
ncbi:protein spaetzle 3 [Nephila pilipes]|uniref:Protein spaetzle 3 n=1 Tax=Nephila pilipes TaxID=299642 RepID=A0A8X6UX86_NEPPI|nr:protein spaetzle 3 [Nephila pilipes]